MVGATKTKQMQLKKQNKKLTSPVSSKTVKLENFNPVVKPGYEIVCATLVHNFSGATHVTTDVRRKAT